MTSNPGRLTAIISVYTSSGDQHMDLGGGQRDPQFQPLIAYMTLSW